MEARELVEAASQLHVARGKKVVRVNLRKQELDGDEIMKLIIGPTGNLRAPTLQMGKTLVVGFNDEMYTELFG